METSEFPVELRKKGEKDNIMENSCAMFQQQHQQQMQEHIKNLRISSMVSEVYDSLFRGAKQEWGRYFCFLERRLFLTVLTKVL